MEGLFRLTRENVQINIVQYSGKEKLRPGRVSLYGAGVFPRARRRRSFPGSAWTEREREGDVFILRKRCCFLSLIPPSIHPREGGFPS